MNPNDRKKFLGQKRYVRVVTITRVSTSKQAQVLHGSLDLQKDSISDYVKRLNAQHPDCFYDIIYTIEEDKSGKREELHRRKGLEKANRLIKKGEVDAVIVEKLDRLSRDQAFNLQFMQTLIENGCEFHEAESGQVDFRKREHRFNFTFRNFQAEDYQYELSEKKFRKYLTALFHNGKDSSSYNILGLDHDPVKSCFYIHSVADRPVFDELKNQFLKCHSFSLTAKYLNSKKFVTKIYTVKEYVDRYGIRQPTKIKGGKKFTAAYVRGVLTSTQIRGIKRITDIYEQFPEYADENGIITCRLAHEPLLSEEEIAQIDSVLLKNKKHYSPSDDFLFLKLLQSVDGNFYTGDSTLKTVGKRKRKYLYYEDVKGIESSYRRINATKFEAEVMKRIKEYLTSSDVFRNLFKSNTELATYEKTAREEVDVCKTQLREKTKLLDKMSSNLRELLTQDGEISQKVILSITSEKSKLQSEVDECRVALLKAEKVLSKICDGKWERSLREGLGSLLTNFDKLPNCDKIRVLGAIIGKIILHPNGRVEIFVKAILDDCGSEPSGVNTSTGKNWRERRDSNPRPSA